MQITTLPKDDVKRGEIYYISRGGYNTGSEQQADRPGVIVSNDKNNKNSQTLEVVYLTTQPKNELPTHCTIRSTGRVSTVLCEQIHTVAVERIGKYIGVCTAQEMQNIDIGLIKDSLHNGKVKEIEDGQKPKKYSKAQVCKAFVNRIVCGLRKRAMPEEDQEIMDSFKNMMKECADEDGGFTVPEDVSTDIIELRRTENDLEQYVNVEKVATMSGSRVIEVDADSTPWGDVDEGGEFGEEETPNLKQIKYAIKKKGGILKTTRELLQDTATNILAYLNKWIAKKSRATRNAAILNVINTITKGKEVAVATFDDFKDVFNVKLDPAIAVSSIVLTNQDGFNYMDKLKDKDGKYIMQQDPTDATKTLLFGKYPVKVVSNKTLKSTNVLKGGTGSDKNDVTGYKYPVYMGDLKEAVTLFDREKMTIELSTEAGDLWAKDLTGIKVRDRFDVQPVDETAVVKGEISVAVAG